MNKHRTTLIAVIAVGLLAASVAGVAAQDQDSMNAASVTGAIGGWREVSAGTVSTADGIDRNSGVVHAAHWNTTDDRLSGEVTYNGSWLHAANGDISVQSGTYEVMNDAGSWLGDATAYGSESLGIDMDTIILTGHGAYEGLTAYVVLDFSKPREISGVIFPGTMLPMADSHPAE